MRNIKTKILRLYVELRRKISNRGENKTLGELSSHELSVFNTVKEIAIKNQSSVKFDPLSGESLIVLPNMLVTLKQGKIQIHNTTGFLTTSLSAAAFNLLNDNLEIVAHRERRKLKYEVKIRINDFMNKVTTE